MIDLDAQRRRRALGDRALEPHKRLALPLLGLPRLLRFILQVRDKSTGHKQVAVCYARSLRGRECRPHRLELASFHGGAQSALCNVAALLGEALLLGLLLRGAQGRLRSREELLVDVKADAVLDVSLEPRDVPRVNGLLEALGGLRAALSLPLLLEDPSIPLLGEVREERFDDVQLRVGYRGFSGMAERLDVPRLYRSRERRSGFRAPGLGSR